MLVLGIDPGTIRVGYGLIEVLGSRYRAIAYGVLECPETDAAADRLAKIWQAITGMLETHKPDVLALEDGFAGRNLKTALRIGEGRGVVLAAAGLAGVPVEVYQPSTVKRAVTATGRAGKASVATMVRLLLSLSEEPPSDAADALAVALCHAQRTV